MLTGEERVNEKKAIADGAWPHFPLLPVVNRDTRDASGFPGLGLIAWHFGIEDGPIKVFKANLFDLGERAAKLREEKGHEPTIGDVLDGVETIEFDTLDAFLDAGWQGD